MPPTHYVGVTGFMSRNEVDRALAVDPGTYQGKLMVGVLVSHKTIHGFGGMFPNRYPKIEEVKNIFRVHPRALNLVHYASPHPEHLYGQLEYITRFVGQSLDGFQLNMRWPDPNQLKVFRQSHPNMTIVLQAGNDCYLDVDSRPDRLARSLVSYQGLVDHVLFDRSGGKGEGMNYREIGRCIAELRKRTLTMGIGVAGGLRADYLEDLQYLRIFGWPVNIDAEGNLRDKDDHLDQREVDAYLLKAYSMFGA